MPSSTFDPRRSPPVRAATSSRTTQTTGRPSYTSRLVTAPSSALFFEGQLDNEYFPIESTPSGALYNKGLSATTQVIALMARLGRHQDLANATLHGPDPVAMAGPLLAECKFPDVLVAKAYSHDGKSLDLVLYNGKAPGKHSLTFGRLTPNTTYQLGNGQTLSADSKGRAIVEVNLNGRTPFKLSPA